MPTPHADIVERLYAKAKQVATGDAKLEADLRKEIAAELRANIALTAKKKRLVVLEAILDCAHGGLLVATDRRERGRIVWRSMIYDGDDGAPRLAHH